MPIIFGLPEILKKVIMEKRGLILFVGGTGSGKSTSLAALIDHRNANSSGHIITIEDPIEYVHPHKRCLVNQREVGVDTLSYEDALKNTLRQAPDVILIGEIRSQRNHGTRLGFCRNRAFVFIDSACQQFQSGVWIELSISFPEERRNQLLLDLSFEFKSVCIAKIGPNFDGKRTAAIEILLGTQLVQDLIQKGDIHAIKEAMEKSENVGMQTFDSHLLRLFKEGIISLDEALANSDSPNNLKLKINLSEGFGSSSPARGGDSSKSGAGGLSLQAIVKDEEKTGS